MHIGQVGEGTEPVCQQYLLVKCTDLNKSTFR